MQPQKTTATNKQQREAKSQQNKINDDWGRLGTGTLCTEPDDACRAVDIAGVTSVASGGIGKFAVVH